MLLVAGLWCSGLPLIPHLSTMQDEDNKGSEPRNVGLGFPYPVAIVALAVAALIGTFFLAQSSYTTSTKIASFFAIVTVFLSSAIVLHLRYGGEREIVIEAEEPETDRQLQALDDACEFFAGSLRSSDAFRLVASRIREMVEVRNLSLHLFDDKSVRFRAEESDGPDAERLRGRFSDLTDDGPIARSYYSQVVEIEHAKASARPSAAIPLKNGRKVFGVIHLDFEVTFDPDKLDPLLLDAIGTRSAALIQSSLSFERSQNNALTDAVTDLPNERAFFMMLESQVAESQRKGSTRPLTILSLDVGSFDDINSRFGHAGGDRALFLVAQIIKDHLRQMDFLARASADEFLVVLPTASKEISHDVIARIQTGFFGRRLKITEGESVEIDLNIGWATVGADGETPETLLRVARERKEQTKTPAPNKVVWFPSEFAS